MARPARHLRAGRSRPTSRLARFGRGSRSGTGAGSREGVESAPRAKARGSLSKAWARRGGGPFRRAEGAKAGDAPASAVAKPAGEATPATARRRHVLPLPVRVLATLCAFVLMVAFAVALARITLEPSPASASLAHGNLRPGRSLEAYLDQPELRDAVRQIGGNILLGVPFGVLLPVLAPGARGIWRVLLTTATVMLLVETVQGTLVTGRAFDVDDVILNTSGALVGYLLLGRRLGRVHDRREGA